MDFQEQAPFFLLEGGRGYEYTSEVECHLSNAETGLHYFCVFLTKKRKRKRNKEIKGFE